MLVIRRKAGEAVLVGGDIEIEVIEVSGSRVKLGIRAPRQTLILRKELLETGEENRRAALSLGNGGLAAVIESIPAGGSGTAALAGHAIVLAESSSRRE